LSELLAGVRRGTRYRIFDRDTPVADLVPVDDWRTDEPRGDDASQRRRLVEQGVLRAGEAGGTPREILRAGPRLVRGSAVAVLLGERKTGR
jgi:antitoxin (DNA-binding transcriptional repressor) of toxin-antitoxin stability system